MLPLAVVVDDGSRARSWLVADHLGVIALRNPFNLGIGSAMQTAWEDAANRGYGIAIEIGGLASRPPIARVSQEAWPNSLARGSGRLRPASGRGAVW